MKNIFLIYIVLLLLPLSAISQSLCPPKGISTNPDNPIMKNDFFDWRIQDYEEFYHSDYRLEKENQQFNKDLENLKNE
mgnify:CR=1 FL=1|jgi:hypothetical protein